MTGLLLVLLLTAVIGVVLTLCERWTAGGADTDIEQVNRLLPQIQCGQCGYPGCRPYARAIVEDSAPVNLCPPGGERTIRDLAALLGREATGPGPGFDAFAADARAVIDESACIGCARCLPACPVDAIVGAHRYMHTVITDQCTGCGLCLPPCPVDCIRLTPDPGAETERLQHPVDADERRA